MCSNKKVCIRVRMLVDWKEEGLHEAAFHHDSFVFSPACFPLALNASKAFLLTSLSMSSSSYLLLQLLPCLEPPSVCKASYAFLLPSYLCPSIFSFHNPFLADRQASAPLRPTCYAECNGYSVQSLRQETLSNTKHSVKNKML